MPAAALLLGAWLLGGGPVGAQPVHRAPPDASDAGSSAAGSPLDDGIIFYTLRAGEGPERVARMFGVGVAELLALNGIRDPHRLAVGSVLRIPDPRAERVRRLKAESAELESALAAARAEIAELRSRLGTLDRRLAALQDENAELEARLAGYGIWRAAALVAGVAVAALAVLVVAFRRRAQDAIRRRDAVSREARALRDAVAKYRQLGGQLELKYQRLFAARAEADGGAALREIRRAHGEEMAALDASLAEAEREDEERAEPDEHRSRRGKAA